MNASYLIYIGVCLLLSALFSGVEIAFVSSNKVRYEIDKKKNGLTSRIIKIFFRNPETFISTMLVGNNIALVVYGYLMALMLEPVFMRIWHNEAFILLSQTLVSTILILFTAEFLPKTIFKINPNFALNLFAVPLFVIYVILYPVTKVTTLVSKLVLKGFGMKVHNDGKGRLLTRTDLDFFIQQSIDDNGNNTMPSDPEIILFQNALDFSSLKVRDCMVPRTELTVISIEATLMVLMNLFIETGYSKILVYKGNIDNIVGYIHSSEMFKRPDNWTSKINQIPIVPETMAVNKLMKQLLEKKKSMALVVDEFGGTAGMITMEDLFEEIFGDFEDEHDVKNYVARRLEGEEFELSGRLEIEKVNEMFGLDLPESEDYVTLAGFILHYYQTIPKLHDVIEIDKFIFKITKISTAKIEIVKLKIAE